MKGVQKYSDPALLSRGSEFILKFAAATPWASTYGLWTVAKFALAFAVITRHKMPNLNELFCHLINNILEALEPLAVLEGEVVVEVLADVGDHHVGEWQHLRAVHHSVAPGSVPYTASIHH
jgi:hypothetical protein